MPGLIVIGGPTASGKSALAMHLAEALGGVLINADSMQLYRDLRILTARPDRADEARVPHRLYGILDAAAPASAGDWLELAASAIREAEAQGRVPIVVGGTGLYLHVLLHGIAPVPEIPPQVRARTRALFAELGDEAFHARLARRDPKMAARLEPGDRQRLMRAHEVLDATGRSLAEWQTHAPMRIDLPEPRLGFALVPPRPALHERIAARLAGMVEQGALDEVATLRARELPPALPLLRAVGVRPLLACIEGRMDRDTALRHAIVETRRYAKRQLTWLRHQLPELRPLAGFGEDTETMPDAGRLRRALLTGGPCGT
jgi:tRNA dimethylallyltransferase